MRSLIQSTPAYELSAEINSAPFGHSLRFIGFVPTARRPEEQVRFRTVLSTAELRALQALIEAALMDSVDQEGANR